MRIALMVGERSTCKRRRVGALIVKDRRILSTGYNGAPRGLPHCLDIGCLRAELNIPSGERQEICRGVHAEQNALVQAAYFGVGVADAVIYTTHQPCITCAKLLINAGIRHIYYYEPYPDPLAESLIAQAGIELTQIDPGR
jgi:dCMP deaminase